ncbi:MAG: tRNA (adenine(22)-N(1))-methyltransferase TrmK, partial [Oscillospiraceae bacterium]|nr:tRNA (adenine(22)-N(1))-methyltransferase TrmK [Oscillospiraceae bacterium]
RRFGVEDRMAFFLCDGLTGLTPGCADAVVIAGMGGDTIRHILEQSPWVMEAGIARIVQPQSSVPEFREYLAKSRLTVAEEALVREGRFLYTVMRLENGAEESLSAWESYCSRALLESGSELLPEYLDRQIDGLRKAVSGMEKSGPSERLDRERNAMKELMEVRRQL